MTDYNKFRILVDLPSSNPGLGFSETAIGLASLIHNSEPQFSIAVFGPWGSGKTTLMYEIKRQLNSESVIAVDFSAWRYEKEEHLIVPLLDSIRAALVEWSNKQQALASNNDIPGDKKQQRKFFAKIAIETAKTMGKVMASMLAGVSIKAGLPGAMEISYDANKALSFVSSGREVEPVDVNLTDAAKFAKRLDDAELPQSFYHACFTALSSAFSIFERETCGKRIVVFVDDLDRCLPGGTLEVLESMKLFFDLRGFIFVVGLDRDIVERSIDARYIIKNDNKIVEDQPQKTERIIRGADYLKKIFQVPFSLAPVSLASLDDLFLALRDDAKIDNEQANDLMNRVKPHLAYLFTGSQLNPREVKRYVNAYTIQMKIKPNLNPDIVLTLNNLDFRQDCRNIYEALATFRLESTTALKAYTEGNAEFLEDIDLSGSDIPFDMKGYLSPGGLGYELLTVEDLDQYLDAGEATRSSKGGYYLELLNGYRKFRSATLRAFVQEDSLSFDGVWSEVHSHFASLKNQLVSFIGEQSQNSLLTDIEKWIDSSNNSSEWAKLVSSLNTLKDEGEVEELRFNAKAEAGPFIESLRNELRQIRRRSSLE